MGPENPGFSLALSPAARDVTAGGSGKLDVDIQRIGGFTDPVALSLDGAPAGVTGTFTSVTVPSHEGLTVAEGHSLLLSADSSVKAGIYTLKVSGASNGVSQDREPSSGTAFLAQRWKASVSRGDCLPPQVTGREARVLSMRCIVKRC